MPEICEFQQDLLSHDLTEAGPVPTVADPDGVYPYPSFVETSRRPALRAYRFVRLENEFLRVTVCPDLGGKVHSLVDKRSGQEVLFMPASILPVRILPRLGFVPGGIEVSFPISHSPVQLESVHWSARQDGDRLYVWCGERELHSGMQWTVEYSIGEKDPVLTQRVCFRNPTTAAHPWMSWSNAAVPARADTEFHFPGGPVLRHGAQLETIDWATAGPRRVADLNRMAGFFWLSPDAAAFGAFTPSLGHGLYHLAAPASAPGMKLWTYGAGRDEIWGRSASLSGESYVEIQGGPLRDQSLTRKLAPGESHCHTEFWVPSATPRGIRTLDVPMPQLIPMDTIPAFDWPPRLALRLWLSVLRAWESNNVGALPPAPGVSTNAWAPSGIQELGAALEWAASVCEREQQDLWLFQLGTWQAARGLINPALDTLARSEDDRARALSGRLRFRVKGDAAGAAAAYRAIASRAFALHPQIVVERDLVLAALGPETLGEREHWLSAVAAAEEEWIVERQAALLLDQGRPPAARARLTVGRFQLIHQRYARTELWRRIGSECGTDAVNQPALGEDDLAQFGAYRQLSAC
jgi:hypothetical protein